jgi:hypothetical protein
MSMSMIDHFDRDGTDLRVYQVTASMPARYCQSEPPMSSPIDIAPEASERMEPADIPIVTDKRWKGLFVSSEKHKIEPTCIWLLDGANGTIQRITPPWKVRDLIRLPWDRFVIPVWGAAIASGVIVLLHTHTLLAFSPGVALALILHCLLELRREQVARDLEMFFEGWRRSMAGEEIVEADSGEMIRRIFAPAGAQAS